jgi:hypothetical protein
MRRKTRRRDWKLNRADCRLVSILSLGLLHFLLASFTVIGRASSLTILTARQTTFNFVPVEHLSPNAEHRQLKSSPHKVRFQMYLPATAKNRLSVQVGILPFCHSAILPFCRHALSPPARPVRRRLSSISNYGCYDNTSAHQKVFPVSFRCCPIKTDIQGLRRLKPDTQYRKCTTTTRSTSAV